MTGIKHMFKCGGLVINPLRFSSGTGYISCVVPQWATGIGTPSKLSATPDALCVFFYVATHATAYRFLVWCAARRAESFAALYVTAHHIIASMVAQAGHPQGWPVLDSAGSSNPVWAIAIMKIGTFGDSNFSYQSEVAIWLRSLPKLTRNIPGFFWPFAVRTCKTNHTESRSLHPIIPLRDDLSRVNTLLLMPGDCPLSSTNSPV